MIEPTAHGEGCVLAVRAEPGARRSGIVGEQNGALKIAVTAPADRGRANQAIEELLAAALGLKKGQVALLTGHGSRSKRFLLRGVTAEDGRARVAAVVGKA